MMNDADNPVYFKALALRDILARTQHRLVLAESCTAGLAAAELGQIPGISAYLCGSMVVYRNNTKHDWLGIPVSLLDDPNAGPVSTSVTEQLARQVLNRTEEATLAAAITGHLGPNAPDGMDAVVYCALAIRATDSTESFQTIKYSCASVDEALCTPEQKRRQRQQRATSILFEHILSSISANLE